ncbi:MAG: hypothetical protein NW205_14080 [Hyphomicrobiaceae bacterium]|nr:hypothetical protein [Hyphomicrobiaceae bacterium]
MKTLAALAALAAVCSASAAEAYSTRLVRACTGDYLSYCSQHSPTSGAVKSCFRANGLKLSQGCVSALVAEGLVSSAEVARHQASAK